LTIYNGCANIEEDKTWKGLSLTELPMPHRWEHRGIGGSIRAYKQKGDKMFYIKHYQTPNKIKFITLKGDK